VSATEAVDSQTHVEEYSSDEEDEEKKENEEKRQEHQILTKKIFCKEHHSAIITPEGELYTTGKNNFGELGIGKRHSKPVVKYFTKVETTFKVKKISFGKDHAVALSTDKQIYVTGSNESGQIGLGDIKGVKKFVKINVVRPGFKIRKIDCGFMHTMALSDVGGFLLVCGNNINGELGVGDRVKKTQVTMLRTNLSPKHIACGASLSLFLTEQSAYSSGINTDGRYVVMYSYLIHDAKDLALAKLYSTVPLSRRLHLFQSILSIELLVEHFRHTFISPTVKLFVIPFPNSSSLSRTTVGMKFDLVFLVSSYS